MSTPKNNVIALPNATIGRETTASRMVNGKIVGPSKRRTAYVRCDEGNHEPAAPFVKTCECGTTYCGRHPHKCEGA